MIDYTIIVPVYCNETSLEILYKEVEEKIFNITPILMEKLFSAMIDQQTCFTMC